LLGFSPVVEWRPSTWGAEVSLEYGKSLRTYTESGGRYRVFGSNGPIGWTGEPLAPGPGVILGRKGAYRGVRFSTEPFYVIDTAYYVLPKTDLDMRWLYYAIIHGKLGEIDDGSPIPSTTRSAVYVRDLLVPPKDEQRAMASTLGALDDKIDLNRRMNETLEAMARAIFKDWFVDFGPVRAKAAGRQPPGLAPDIAALFPDRLDDDDKPTGWERHSVKAGCVAVQNGGTPRRDEPSYWQPATIPWLTSGEVRKPYIVETENFISQAGFNSSSAKWVSADTTVVALYGATAGQVALLAAQLTTNQAVCALSPKPFYRYFNFVGLALSVDRLAQLSRGSAQQNLSKGIVEDFVMPPHEQTVLEAFDKVSAPIFSRIIANEREMRTLAALRDLLLPKLISGEIRIRDAERAMEDAA
jgi:type I restriction enzyme S subunit